MPLALLAAAASLAFAQPAADEPTLARPTPQQLAWQDHEIGMFIHFAPNTWQDAEQDQLSTPLSQINPSRLDTDEWVKAAQDMHAGYIVFVAKHSGGFCWWQTDTTPYSVKHTPWRGGAGDVMAELAESCRDAGIPLGVYLSPMDRTLGAMVGGRTEDPARQAEYTAVFRAQLTELLTRYGPIHEVWFDGSLVFDVGDILAAHAPDAVVFQGPQASIRWVGNEDGVAPDPAWNAVRFGVKPWGVFTADDGDPAGDRWLPNECDARFRDTWFWNTHNDGSLKSLDALMEMYQRSVGHGAVLLLNHTPDTSGAIPDADRARGAEFGSEIERRYGRPIVTSSGTGTRIELWPSAPSTIDAVVLMEDIAHGERVRRYAVQGLVGAEWRTLAEGTAIGHKKIDRFSPIEVSGVRVEVRESAGRPIFCHASIHDTRH